MNTPSAHDPAIADIAVVVVTHESESTVDECLARLRKTAGVAEIRVVDNASRDDTLIIVQRHAAIDARVRFIANPDNPGFAVACNQGAQDSASPWLAFVNPDCLVEADTLALLRQHACELGGSALVGGDLVDETGMRDSAARRRDPDFGAMLRSTSASKLALASDDAQTLQPVDAVSGALMVLPRVLFDRVDGFDAGYRLHVEDLDLCRRVRLSGAIVAVANRVRVVHLRGISSRARPTFVEWHKHRGFARYFGKFEAQQRGVLVRVCVHVAIWGHFAFAGLAARWRGRNG